MPTSLSTGTVNWKMSALNAGASAWTHENSATDSAAEKSEQKKRKIVNSTEEQKLPWSSRSI
jgi:hypothetical protein